jgi:hypothetical protein
MSQSSDYKTTNRIDYLANFPGARRERDVIVAEIAEGEIDVTDRPNRWLGRVQVESLPEPIRTQVSAALASEGDDALLVRSDDALDVSAETVPVEQTETVEVEQARAVAVTSDRPLDVSGQTVPVAIESEGELDLATDDTLASIAAALDSEGDDKLLVDHPSRIDVGDRSNRTLGHVEVDTLPDADRAAWTEDTIDADDEVSQSLSALGADRLLGRIESSDESTVVLSWLDEQGETVFADTLSEDDVDVPAISPDVRVTVTNDSSEEQTVNGVLHLT